MIVDARVQDRAGRDAHDRLLGIDRDRARRELHLVGEVDLALRLDQIDPAIADGPRSVINEQVEMGVAVRMAVLDALLADPSQVAP